MGPDDTRVPLLSIIPATPLHFSQARIIFPSPRQKIMDRYYPYANRRRPDPFHLSRTEVDYETPGSRVDTLPVANIGKDNKLVMEGKKSSGKVEILYVDW